MAAARRRGAAALKPHDSEGPALPELGPRVQAILAERRRQGDECVSRGPGEALVRVSAGATVLNEAQIGALVGAVIDRLHGAGLPPRERDRRVREWRRWARWSHLWTCPRCNCDHYTAAECVPCDLLHDQGFRRGTPEWIAILRRVAELLLQPGGQP